MQEGGWPGGHRKWNPNQVRIPLVVICHLASPSELRSISISRPFPQPIIRIKHQRCNSRSVRKITTFWGKNTIFTEHPVPDIKWLRKVGQTSLVPHQVSDCDILLTSLSKFWPVLWDFVLILLWKAVNSIDKYKYITILYTGHIKKEKNIMPQIWAENREWIDKGWIAKG